MPWWIPICILAGVGVVGFAVYVIYVFMDERWNGDRS